MGSLKLLLWFFSTFFKRFQTRLIFITTLCVIQEIMVTLYFLFLKPIVDTAVYSRESAVLFRWGIIYIAVFFLGFGLLVLNNILSTGLRLGLEQRLRQYFYNHSLEIPANIIFAKQSGYLMQRILNDVDVSLGLISRENFVALGQVVASTFLFWVLITLNPKLALIALATYPIHLLNIWVFGPKLRVWAEKVQEYFAQLSAKIQESLQAVTTICVLNIKESEKKTFGSQLSFYLRIQWQYFWRGLIINTSIPHLIHLPLFGVLVWIGAYDVLQGRFSVGSFISFFLLLMNITAPIRGIMWLNSTFQPSLAAIGRLHEFYKYKPPKVKKEYIPVPARIGYISFEGVNFSYDTRTAVLKDFHLKIPNSQVVAIIGPSGAGKTTVIGLLLGFLMPSSGTIKIDGVNLHDFDLEEWRKVLGLIEQDTFIFNRTIYENIQIGRLQASQEEIEEAARKSGLQDFISSLPQGYQTIVGERGFALSGGERQRIAIARIFLKSPSVIIMDEPTSALDLATEEKIMKELEALAKNRTVLLTSHRPSLLKMADIVYKLKGGKIVNYTRNN